MNSVNINCVCTQYAFSMHPEISYMDKQTCLRILTFMQYYSQCEDY